MGDVLSSDEKTFQVVLGRLLNEEGVRVAGGYSDSRYLCAFFFETAKAAAFREIWFFIRARLRRKEFLSAGRYFDTPFC